MPAEARTAENSRADPSKKGRWPESSIPIVRFEIPRADTAASMCSTVLTAPPGARIEVVCRKSRSSRRASGPILTVVPRNSSKSPVSGSAGAKRSTIVRREAENPGRPKSSTARPMVAWTGPSSIRPRVLVASTSTSAFSHQRTLHAAYLIEIKDP